MIAVVCCQFWVLVNDMTRDGSPFVKALEGVTGGNETSPTSGPDFQGKNPAE
jgi:hypothetical protein